MKLKRLSRLRAAGVLGVCVFALACSSTPGSTAAAVKAEQSRKMAPDFTLKDASGATVHLSDYKGKVLILDFWATWCGPCKIEIPWFKEFETEFRNRGFAVLGVSMDEGGWETVKPYIDRMKINYRILMGTDQVGQLYGGVDSLPTTFLIDRAGRIAAVHVGLETSKDGFRNEINRLLEAPHAAALRDGRTAGALFARAE